MISTKIKLAVKLLTHPVFLIGYLTEFYGRWLPEKLYLRLVFRKYMGYSLNLNNPKTFSEKLQWLKLYDRKSEYTRMVDKLAVKEYVASIIGKEYIIPTISVWNSPEDIEWEKLPPKFVLKTTHSGGSLGVVVCHDKSKLDKEKAIKQLNIAMKDDIYSHYKEWPYKDVPKRIIAEKLMEDYSQQIEGLTDYVFFCFNGEPRYCQVIKARNKNETIDIFDMSWEHHLFVKLNLNVCDTECPIKRPVNFDEMKSCARKLSKGIPYSRIDLYEINSKTYFGEVTFYPASGLGRFKADEYDDILSEMIKLPGTIMLGAKIEIGDDTTLQVYALQRADLRDYKFFCFNGQVKFFKVDFNRFEGHHANYYDLDGHLLPFYEKNLPNVQNDDFNLPKCISKMVVLAEQLSKGKKFLRVDFYSINGKIFFGELTFFPASGMGRWNEFKWDLKIGHMLNLS